MPDDEIVAAWSRFHDCLSAQAPSSAAALHPPLPSGSGLTKRLNLTTPSILDTWYSLHNGSSQYDASGYALRTGVVLPANVLNSQAEAVKSTEMIREIWASLRGSLGSDQDQTVGRAGEPAGSWLPEYVQLTSDGSGGGFFLDLRDGPLHGCVGSWDKVDIDALLPIAPSLSTLLDNATRAIETGQPAPAEMTPFDLHHPVVTDGVLAWEMSDD